MGVVLLAAASSAWAGSISLQVRTTARLQGKAWLIDVAVANAGDDTAYQARVLAQSGEDSQATPPPGLALAPGAKYVFHLSLPDRLKAPGQYPLVVRLDYADANQYPFSALSVASLPKGGARPPGVFGVLEGVALPGRETAVLRLKNVDAQEKHLRVRLELPRELSADEPARQIDLGASAEGTARFRIRRFSARPGSTYPIFALVEYDSNGEHHLLASPAAATISEAPPSWATPRLAVLAAFALAALWAAIAWLKP